MHEKQQKMPKKSTKTQEVSANPADSGQNEPETPKTSLFDAAKAVKVFGEQDEGKLLEQMSVAELLELRAMIDARLPARRLSDMDLEEEVLLQFARTKSLYDTVAQDKHTPANQRAQVANSCTTILDQLIKMQARLYSAERVKALETALIRTLKEFPADLQERFFELYERQLEAAGTPTPTPFKAAA